jgi:glycosyltransferase involved in cell wall biosynthesis
MAGAQVELYASSFAYGRLAAPEGYVRNELFYRAALGSPGSRVRRLSKLAEHVPDMLRYRHAARAADVVHFQWLAVQHVDRWLLPSRRSGRAGVRPLVLTAHDVLPREPRAGQLSAMRRLYERFDAVVVHSEHGRGRLSELGVPPERVHVIPHGVFAHLTEPRGGAVPPGPALQTDKPVVLFFGLIRPYKGLEVLLDAWRGIEDAELWIVGMPKMDISRLRSAAPSGVRFVTRFVSDGELAGYFERADLVVAPYLQADQSGVLFTALAFGKPLLLSDVGGFPELERTGAAQIVPAGDSRALARALRELLSDRATLTKMCVKARAATDGHYSWESVAQAHLALYERLLEEGPRR